ncbi:MAG: 16S rRNA processing protein RimM [Chloroflexi bacterium]|nr:16S rRNA processing protein RimM [Chloroflexota bacterium]
MADAPRYLRVAQVRGVRGLDGSIRLEVLSDHPDQRFAPGSQLVFESTSRSLTIAEVTPASPGLFVRFIEVGSRLAAERLVGGYLTVPADRSASPNDRVLWDEVIGIMVRDPHGRPIGEIRDLYRAGGAEVYILSTPSGGELDLPAVSSVITEFAPREGRIIADLTGSELSERLPAKVKRRGPTKRSAGERPAQVAPKSRSGRHSQPGDRRGE